MTSRDNTLDPKNDIRGTDIQDSSFDVTEESLQIGGPVAGQNGTGASIIEASGVVSVSGVSGMSIEDSLGGFINISGAATVANNGTFQIIDVFSGSSIRINNVLGVTDANNGSIVWEQRMPYSLESDINYARSDRANIKGVDFDELVPTYIRPDATTTDVNTNLANIAGKTTDATTIVINSKTEDVAILPGDGYASISGSFDYATAINTLGYSISDGFDAGNEAATFVYIVSDGYAAPLFVLNGGNAGDRIFGFARQGATGSDGYSIEVEFRSVPFGQTLSSSSPYTWESGLTDIVDMYLGLRGRLDQVADTYLRTEWVNGLFGSSGGSSGSGAPTGSAGGDLSGTYPNPTVVNLTIAGQVQGSIIYFNGANWVHLAPDTDGYVLTTRGSGDNPEWAEAPGAASGITATQHAALRQLIHLADTGGPFEEFASGAYREILPVGSPFPTSIIWYESVAKTDKIIEKTIVRNANKTPATITWEAYSIDGFTVVATVTDTISYSGVIEIDRIRTIS